MLDFEEVQERLQDRRLCLAEVARETGITYQTIWRITSYKADGDKMQHGTIRKLSDYLQKGQGSRI